MPVVVCFEPHDYFSQVLIHASRMAEVIAVIGVLAAASQLAKYAAHILSLAATIPSDTRNGLGYVLKEIALVREFIFIADKIRDSQSGAFINEFVSAASD